METVRDILIEVLGKRNDEVVIKYHGNSIMVGDVNTVFEATSTFLRNRHATKESHLKFGRVSHEIIIKDGEI